MAVLEIKGLRKSFGGVMAVAGVDLKVEDKRIDCIIGPNGAGKSTLFNLVSGYYACDEGRVFFKGKDITGLPPQKIARMGIGRSFQVTNIFPKLTVFENIQATFLYTGGKGLKLFSDARKLFREETEELLKKVGLIDQARELAGILSAGDRKRLELGIVLATGPELLLLDEPTCGMSPVETTHTIELIREIAKRESLAVLFTEHKMDVVFSIAF
ncbi:MAG: ABC transporter ATP-binding protein, partial [Desulfobacteraceae bacterium]|nr:ABC transporter ATP-binding protein [Desulfobacteraceae bacterium]